MVNKRTLLLALAGVIAAMAVGTLTWRSSKVGETVAPKRGEIVEAIYALGKVKARRQYDVKIGVLTTVEKLYVREGDSIAQGAPLVKFSDSNIFRAPFSGVVTLLTINEGEPAIPSTTLLRVDDLSDKFIEVSLEQQGALRVTKGLPAEIVFESLRGEKLKGRVSTIFSKNDEFLAHIEVEDGLKETFLPGMTADVAIIVGKHLNSLLIPVRAINNGYVVSLRDGKRTKVPVKIGAIDGQMAEVIGGDLKESDHLVLGGK